MDIKVRTLDHTVVLAPDAALDTRSSGEFERTVREQLKAGSRHFVIDFGKVDLITSAGLRVLVMLGKKLASGGKQLVLCSLNEMIRNVLEVSGLTNAFKVAAAEKDALDLINAASRQSAEAAGPATSKITHQVHRLLTLGEAIDTGVLGQAAGERGPAIPALAAAVHELLQKAPAPPDAPTSS